MLFRVLSVERQVHEAAGGTRGRARVEPRFAAEPVGVVETRSNARRPAQGQGRGETRMLLLILVLNYCHVMFSYNSKAFVILMHVLRRKWPSCASNCVTSCSTWKPAKNCRLRLKYRRRRSRARRLLWERLRRRLRAGRELERKDDDVEHLHSAITN